MRMDLIYPTWPKLARQTEFHLPPHGPVVFAAAVPEEVTLEFIDENVQEVPFDGDADLVGISVMLTCQLPRAFAIADRYRAMGVPVLFGGIAAMLHAEEVTDHCDSIFLGEVEGRLEGLFDDFRRGELKRVYDYMGDPPDIERVGTARREILDRDRYNYRGVQMFDLVHASRGCKFNCYPCCSAFLGGRDFRPRPVETVIAEMASIPNNRMFIVDNSLAQDREWLKTLFTEMAPLKKKWCSHPILYDEEILKLAADAGCWYVYQAIVDTSDMMRDRIKMLKDNGIGIEGTILLGMDNHDEDYILRLVDFLMENELDMAEFTVLTPYPHTRAREQLQREGRILANGWEDYSCDKVVFQPKNISAERLQELYYYAWDTFYADGGYQIKMGDLFLKVIRQEILDGTYHRYNPGKKRSFKREGR